MRQGNEKLSLSSTKLIHKKLPVNFPKRAIPLSDFTVVCNKNQQEQKTSHEMVKVIKTKKITPEIRALLDSLDEKNEKAILDELVKRRLLFYLKFLDPQLKNDSKEAWRAQVLIAIEPLFNEFSLLQKRKYFSSSRPVFDPEDDNRFMAVASKGIAFTPNYKSPLKAEELKIDLGGIKTAENRMRLNECLNTLNALLTRGTEGMVSQVLEKINNYNPSPTATKLKKYLETYLNSDNRYLHHNLKCLENELKSRLTHISTDSANQVTGVLDNIFGYFTHKTNQQKESESCQNEKSHLQQALALITQLLKYDDSNNCEKNIEQLDCLDRQIRQSGILLHTLPDKDSISKYIKTHLEISVQGLKHYRIRKSLPHILTICDFEEEVDLHNHNLGRHLEEGCAKLDFDLSNAPISVQLKWFKYGIEKSVRTPTEETFAISETRYRKFPNIPVPPYYWVTSKTILPLLLIEHASYYLQFLQNFYTEEHTKLFSDFEHDPIFKFHQNIATLKRMLTDSIYYQHLIDMDMPKDFIFADEDWVDNEFLTYAKASIENIKTQLIATKEKIRTDLSILFNAPEFQDFLALHGAYALDCILEEFSEEKAYLAKKLANKPYYKTLHDAIDLDKIAAEYDRIFNESKADRKVEVLDDLNVPTLVNVPLLQ